MSTPPSRRQTIKSTRRAMRSALATLVQLQEGGWSFAQRCGDAECSGCKVNEARRTRAKAAMGSLRRELNKAVSP